MSRIIKVVSRDWNNPVDLWSIDAYKDFGHLKLINFDLLIL